MFVEFVEKRRLRRRFERSLPSYQQAAQVQEEMALRLAEVLRSFPSPQRVLEIGPGVGLLTRKLRSLWPESFYLAVDLVPGCALHLAPWKVHFVVADAEDLSWLRGEFDLIVSNATFQWFREPQKALRVYHRLLRPKGLLAFTTFGPQTMWELEPKQSSLLPLARWRKMGQSFSPLFEKCWERRLYFSSPAEVLKHIRQTGALGSLPACWSLKRLKNFLERYQKYREPQGFPLTYEPILLVWEK